MVKMIILISNLSKTSLPCNTKINLDCLPNDKMFVQSNLKAPADKKINRTQKLKIVYGRAENIVGKGENAGYQQFLLFPQCFQKG